MAKLEAGDIKRERKSSPIHVEKLLAQEHAGAQPVWIKDAEYPTVAVARDNIKAGIADGDTMRIIRVLGTFRKKIVKRETLESV